MIPVDESPLFQFGDIAFTGATLFDHAILARVLGIKAGEVASEAKIRAGLVNLETIYGSRGNLDASFLPKYRAEVRASQAQGILDLEIQIKEGRQFQLRRLRIIGTEQVRAKDIRRDLLPNDGEVLNSALLEYSINKLKQCGSFKDVTFEIVPLKSPSSEIGLADVVVRVEEF